MVSEGRFSNISTIYDPEKNIVKGGVKSNHNAYGYVTSTHNYQVRNLSPCQPLSLTHQVVWWIRFIAQYLPVAAHANGSLSGEGLSLCTPA